MAAWMKWFEDIGDSTVDAGNPVSQVQTVAIGVARRAQPRHRLLRCLSRQHGRGGGPVQGLPDPPERWLGRGWRDVQGDVAMRKQPLGPPR
jgi:hypothetical protein